MLSSAYKSSKNGVTKTRLIYSIKWFNHFVFFDLSYNFLVIFETLLEKLAIKVTILFCGCYYSHCRISTNYIYIHVRDEGIYNLLRLNLWHFKVVARNMFGLNSFQGLIPPSSICRNSEKCKSLDLVQVFFFASSELHFLLVIYFQFPRVIQRGTIW